MRSVVSNAGRIIWYVTNYHSSKKRKSNFWSVVKGLAKSHKSTCAPIVDGISGGDNIASKYACQGRHSFGNSDTTTIM